MTVANKKSMSSRLPTAVRHAISPNAALPLVVLISISMLILPMPVILIDLMVAVNLFFGVFLLLSTIYAGSILNLTTFPSLLLLTTIFRLGVSVCTTRAILSDGDAGAIIKTIGEIVIGDKLAVGIVVFVVVGIVQFIVIAKGGERIAEVSARFTLDALPGKQMSIDADVRNGDLTKEAARMKRQRLEQESQFFGAMDGAMRFVKGDSIASFVIVFINLLGGLIVGTMSFGMSFGQAAEKFLVLSVGDGLIAQVPSILSTLAAAILTTRITNEEAGTGLGADIFNQLRHENRAWTLGALLMIALGLAPGFPATILVSLGLTMLAGGWLIRYFAQQRDIGSVGSAGANDLPPEAVLERARFDDPIVAVCSPDLVARLEAAGVAGMLKTELVASAAELGIAIHPIKFRLSKDARIDQIVVLVEGVLNERISVKHQIEPAALARELAEITTRGSNAIMSVDDAAQWLEACARSAPRLVEGIQQQVPMGTLAEVLRRLLEENVPLKHPRLLLTALSAAASHRFSPEEFVEDCRVALAAQIREKHRDASGQIVVLMLQVDGFGDLEEAMEDPLSLDALDEKAAMIRRAFQAIRLQIEHYREAHPDLVLCVPRSVRSIIRRVLQEQGFRIAVLAFEEINGAAGLLQLEALRLNVMSTDGTPREIHS